MSHHEAEAVREETPVEALDASEAEEESAGEQLGDALNREPQ